MKLLVWQWGRRGAGPLLAASLAAGFAALPRTEAALSLAAGAELLAGPDAPDCAWPVATYAGPAGLVARALAAPLLVAGLARRVAALAPDLALCAMPAALDGMMAAALARARVPWALIVHDATPHPGDSAAFVRLIQARSMRRAGALVALSRHVAARLAGDPASAGKTLLRARLPPFAFGVAPIPPPRAHGGALRLLCLGRLRAYKGLDLLADALARLGPRDDLAVRIVGQGPALPALARLRALPGVVVERRWVPEAELAALLAWADAVVLPYREASQSGLAPAALAAGRWVLATAVGGLPEQLAGAPNGRLCAPEPDALAAAITALLAEPAPRPVMPDAAAWRDEAASLRAGLEAALSGRQDQ